MLIVFALVVAVELFMATEPAGDDPVDARLASHEAPVTLLTERAEHWFATLPPTVREVDIRGSAACEPSAPLQAGPDDAAERALRDSVRVACADESISSSHPLLTEHCEE